MIQILSYTPTVRIGSQSKRRGWTKYLAVLIQDLSKNLDIFSGNKMKRLAGFAEALGKILKLKLYGHKLFKSIKWRSGREMAATSARHAPTLLLRLAHLEVRRLPGI